MTDRLVEQNPRPPRSQDHIHHAGRGRRGLEVEKRLPHRLAGIALIIFFPGKKIELYPPATAVTADLAVPLLFDNAGNIEAGKRLDISHNPSLRRGYQHDLVLACQRDKHIFDPRVHIAGETVHLVKQRDLLFQRNLGGLRLHRIEIVRTTPLFAHGNRRQRFPILCDMLSGASRQGEIFYGDVIGKGVTGLRLRQYPDANAIGRGARAVFHHPLF